MNGVFNNVGKCVTFKYPCHGWRNILRKVEGKIKAYRVGPNGVYLVMDTACGHKHYSVNKIIGFHISSKS